MTKKTDKRVTLTKEQIVEVHRYLAKKHGLNIADLLPDCCKDKTHG